MSAKHTTRYFFGTLLLLFGLILFLDVFLIIPNRIYSIIFNWKNIIILLGIFLLFKDRGNRGGIILIVIGVTFHLARLFRLDLSDFVFPILFMAGGIYLLVNVSSKKKAKDDIEEIDFKDIPSEEPNSNNPSDAEDTQAHSTNDLEYIDQFSFFGSYKQTYNRQIVAGKVISLFANSKVDLSQATVNNKQTVLDISCIFGNVDIYIPKEWAIKSQMAVFLGSFSDNAHHLTNLRLENQDLIILKGVVTFGSVRVFRV